MFFCPWDQIRAASSDGHQPEGLRGGRALHHGDHEHGQKRARHRRPHLLDESKLGGKKVRKYPDEKDKLRLYNLLQDLQFKLRFKFQEIKRLNVNLFTENTSLRSIRDYLCRANKLFHLNRLIF